MDPEQGVAVAATEEISRESCPPKGTTKDASFVRKLLMGALLAIFTIKLYALGHELVSSLISNTVPAELLPFGATSEMVLEHARAAMRSIPATATKLFCVFVFYFLILYFDLLSRLWKRLATKHTNGSKPTVQATIFMGLWYMLLEVGASLESSDQEHSMNPFAWRYQQALIYGALMGFLFHRLAKNTRPVVTFACLVAWFILSQLLLRIGTFYLHMLKLRPLHRNNTTEPIFKMAEMVGMSTSRIFTQGSGSPYYFGAMIDEMIVLSRNVLDKAPRLMYSAMAHELGHRAHKHYLFRTIWSVSLQLLGPTMAVFGVLHNPTLYEAFGFPSAEPIVAALPIAEAVSFIVQELLEPIHLWRSRVHEYEADAYAVKKGHFTGLSLFLTMLVPQRWDLSWLYEKLFKTHPSTLNRVLAMMEVKRQV